MKNPSRTTVSYIRIIERLTTVKSVKQLTPNERTTRYVQSGLVVHLRLLEAAPPHTIRDGGEHVEQQCQSARVEPDEPTCSKNGHEHVAAHGAAARTVVLAQ